MREGREGFRSSQLDLFAWRERNDDSAETLCHGGRPRDALQPNRWCQANANQSSKRPAIPFLGRQLTPFSQCG